MPARHASSCGLPATLAATLAAAGLLAVAPARAQTPPGAGQVLQETQRPAAPTLPPAAPPRVLEAPVRPTITMPEGATVEVASFRISGAVSFPDTELAALVAPWVGRRLDLRGLNEAATAITRFYQSRGHLLSYAYLPAQRVADGVIELAVLEGRIEAVQIVTAQEVRLKDEVIQAHTDRLAQGGPALQPQIERQLLLLNDMPGVTVRAAFTPGGTTGGADMVVSVAEDEPFQFRAEFNNHGSVSTGRYRVGLTAQLNDVFGWGDHTVVRGLLSNRGSLTSGSLRTVVPVGGDGWRVGGSLSRLSYQLAGPFDGLGAGTANTVGLEASYPLRRTLDNSITAKASFDHRRLSDEITLIGQTNAKRNDSGELAFSFDLRDTWGGASAGSLAVTMGQLRSGTEPRQEWRKLSAQFARLQALGGPFSAYLRAAGQFTGRPLDSSEKLGLAGAGAVRAYAPGELSVDQGGTATLELRYAMDFLGGSVVGALFHDQGWGRVARVALPPPGNDVEIHGSGLSLAWTGAGIGVNASLAWRGGRVPTAERSDPRPRLLLQLLFNP